MPYKRWYFQQRGEEIIVISDEKEMKRGGKVTGRVKTIEDGAQEAKAKGYKEQAILVKFMMETAVLNRNYFDWNQSSFSHQFRSATSTATFLKIWKAVTKVGDLGYAIWRETPNHLSTPLTSASGSVAESDTEVHSKGHGDGPEQPPPAKRPRTSNAASVAREGNQLDVSIESKRIGLLRVPIRNTTEPPQCRLLRRIDPVFVESLVTKIAADPLGPGVPPLAVVCTSVDSKANFKKDLKDIYKYEVHGGTHSRAARLALLTKDSKNEAYIDVFSDVFVGLTDAECLRLAARHNINGHFHHNMTHRDYLEACRARLFTIAEKDVSSDPTPAPTTVWKKSCVECILPPDMSRTTRENIYCQASFAQPVWELALQVMDLYEEGKLKQQKLFQRNLTSTPEFKQHHFQPLHHLDESFQAEVLELVVTQVYSLSELKDACNSHRAMASIKKAFVRCTHTSNWDEAVGRFGAFADESRLAQFSQLNFQKQVPDPFRDYCQAALSSENPSAVDSFTVTKNGATGYVLSANPITLTAVQIKSAIDSYTGAHLIVTHIPQDWSAAKMEDLAYTTRQLNSASTSLALFNFAVVCEPRQMTQVERSLLKCYDRVSTVFAHNKTTPVPPGIGLVSSVWGVVIGHWSQSTELCPEHFAARAHNFLEFESSRSSMHGKVADHSTPLDLMKKLICLFSYEGQLVLDLMSGTGSGVLAALSTKRSGIAVEEDAELVSLIKRRLVSEHEGPPVSPEVPLQTK